MAEQDNLSPIESMSNGLFHHLQGKSAADLCAKLALSGPAQALLAEHPAPAKFLARLLEQQHFQDAVKFLAQALPKRDAVLWACRVTRAAGTNLTVTGEAALRAAENWATDPSDENRRATKLAADAAGLGTPAGCAAMAAFLSGGSLVPPNVPAIPPPEHFTGLMVSGAILMAVVADPGKAAERYREFIAEGVSPVRSAP